jgi:hypothetical protein
MRPEVVEEAVLVDAPLPEEALDPGPRGEKGQEEVDAPGHLPRRVGDVLGLLDDLPKLLGEGEPRRVDVRHLRSGVADRIPRRK